MRERLGLTWAVPAIWILFLFISFTPTQLTAQTKIALMAYNVENLFDATDDGAEQGDMAFLPMIIKQQWGKNYCQGMSGFYYKLCADLDWVQEKYEKKLAKIASVLLDYNNGKGADIITLEELENKQVITDLWEKHLKQKGYLQPIHFESPSYRGIDVGILSKLPLVEPPRAHKVDLTGIGEATRDIVEATFWLPYNQKLRVTANHWPSQGHSVSTRLVAAILLKTLAEKAQQEGIPFIALGDFNTIDSESPNPIGQVADSLPPRKEKPLVDIHSFIGKPKKFPPATHYYRGKWDHLDRILASKDLFSKSNPVQINPFSFTILAHPYLFKEVKKNQNSQLKKIPFRYDFFTDEGYSDHLPIAIQLLVHK